jgi:predicted RNase H-like nuclease (RuvC/YqgF family)
MEEDKTQEALQDCEEKLRHLEEENRQLRQASRVFGQLADRLTSTLREERRMAAADRRLRARRYPERRQRTVQAPTHTAND